MFTISCNKLHATIIVARIINLDAQFTISCVACILMHDQTTHRTLFNPFGCSRFCATHETSTLSDAHDFMRSVHLDARPNHARNVISPFQTFTISCNKLHATLWLLIALKNFSLIDRTWCNAFFPATTFHRRNRFKFDKLNTAWWIFQRNG